SVEVHQSVRNRFWYFTFAACDVDIEIAPSFEIHAVNSRQGFEQEFGMDQRGTLLLQIAAAACFLCLGFLLRFAGRVATGSEARGRCDGSEALEIRAGFYRILAGD
ncbi:tmem145, partial [Symbiodinium sp. CCMP2456]